MPYRSPADFCAEYAAANNQERVDEFGGTSRLESVAVVSKTLTTARVEARWFTFGHAAEAGYYDVVEPILFFLVKRDGEWHVVSEEALPYEWGRITEPWRVGDPERFKGDMEVNETKVANLVQAADLRPMTEDEIVKIGSVPGYGSAIGLHDATIVVDDLVAASTNLVAGANLAGYHLLNVNAGRDYQADLIADVTAARAGDACPACGHELRTTRGVEAGNIFKLGTRYSADMNAVFLDSAGERKPLTMGCYGIGVGRLLACAAEENRDEKGLRLPASIAPYHVSLVLLDTIDSPVGELAQRFYDELWATGIEVLFDDRTERAGVKFADADVIGLPLRITMGKRGFSEGTAELRERATGETTVMPLKDVVTELRDRITAIRAALDERVTVELPEELLPTPLRSHRLVAG